MTFFVGQKVVYVGPDFSNTGHAKMIGQAVPVVGHVYTIRAINEIYGEPAFLLHEIRNEPRRWACGETFELHMNACFFRPLVEKKTDISFAHEILRNAHTPEPVH